MCATFVCAAGEMYKPTYFYCQNSFCFFTACLAFRGHVD